MNPKRVSIAMTAVLTYALLAPTATSARATARTSTRAVPYLTTTIPVPCSTWRYTDASGDTASHIDVVGYELQTTCNLNEWSLAVHTSRGFNDPDLGSLVFAADTDGNATNNCSGAEVTVVAGWVPELHQLWSTEFEWQGSCGLYNERNQTTLVSHAPGSNVVRLAMRLTAKFSWSAGLASSPRPSGNDFDFMPNSGRLATTTTSLPLFKQDRSTSLRGAYTQVVPGDYNGDGRDDLLFYAAGTTPDYIWYGHSTGVYDSKPVTINGAYRIVSGDFDGDGISDLLFYAPGTAHDFVWYGSPAIGSFESHELTINGVYSIVSGDFDGNDADDLFLYGPGTGTDYVGRTSSGRSIVTTPSPTQVNNPYQVAAGDFDGDHHDDVLLYAAGSVPDAILHGQTGGTFVASPLTINGTYAIVRAGDFNGDDKDDVLFFNPDTAPDALLYGHSTAPYLPSSDPATIVENYTDAVVLDWNTDGSDDLLLYGAGNFPDRVFTGPANPVVITNNIGSYSLTVGQPFSLQLHAIGGTPPYEWFASQLPAGLSINATSGLLSGTPTAPGFKKPIVTAIDSRDRHAHYTFAMGIGP